MEGKVNWHYTCRVCGEIVRYGFAAGPAIGTCNKCKKTDRLVETDEYGYTDEEKYGPQEEVYP